MEGKPEESQVNTITQQFDPVINAEFSVDINTLKKLTWQGVPHHLRPTVWKLLLGYLSSESTSRAALISAKRDDYKSYVKAYFGDIDSKPTNDEKNIFKCFEMDAPRMQPSLPLFQHEAIQQIMIRVSWICYMKHFADKDQDMQTTTLISLVTPLIAVFMQEYAENTDYSTFEVPENFGKEQSLDLEADVYWSLCGIVEKIRQNLSFKQAHANEPFDKMKEILKKSDPDLIEHFEKQDIDFKFFAYRWIFVFFLFDLPLKTVIRLFDTYIADEQGFGVLHCYLCCSILEKESQKIKDMDFNEIIMLLSQKATRELSEEDIQLLIQDAHKQRERNGDANSSED